MTRYLCVGCCLLFVGCYGQEPRVEAPPIDPEGYAAKAIELYDTNDDGFLAGDELKKAGSLRGLAGSDKKVSKDEIAARLQSIVDSQLGMATMTCEVRSGGNGVPGVKVTFEPEAFMGGSIKPASGVTNEDGVADIAMSGDDGAQPGFYKVKLTREGDDLPAKYNEETELGQEVSYEALQHGNVVFNID